MGETPFSLIGMQIAFQCVYCNIRVLKLPLRKLLPELYDTTWENKAFRTLVKTYMLELDLYPYNRSPAVETWVLDRMEAADLLLLSERMLLADFNIVQYIARPA